MGLFPLHHLPKPSSISPSTPKTNSPATPLNDAGSLTFLHDDDEIKPPIAFADDIFRNGVIMPLSPHSLKLPPRLQEIGSGSASPRSPRIASSPKSPRKIGRLKGWKDFDPFMAAVERIRKEDEEVKPFHWRQLETSFKESFARVFDEAWGEIEWDVVVEDEVEVNVGRRSKNFYRRLDGKEGRICCKKGRQNWRLLACCLRYNG